MTSNGEWNDMPNETQFPAVYELPLNDSVEYFEDNEIENLDLTEMKKNPIRKISGSLIFIGSLLQIQKINLNQKK